MATQIVHPVRLSVAPQTRVQAGPMFQLDQTAFPTGFVHTNAPWPYALWGYTLQYKGRNEDFREIQGFWLARQGGAYGFFLKDFTDFSDEGMGKVVLVDGVYRLVKEYPDYNDYNPYQRWITRPLTGTITLSGVGGTPVIDYATGIVSGASSTGTWTGQYDVPCVFANDSCRPTYEPAEPGKEISEWVSVILREVHDYTIAT